MRPSPAGCFLSLLLTPAVGLSLALLGLFESWRGRLAAGWLLVGCLGLMALLLRRSARRRWSQGLATWAAGVLGLALLSPGSAAFPGPASHADLWLRLSPFNLVPETDLVRVGLAVFYPGAAGKRIWSLSETLYQGQRELPTAVSFTAADLCGLGTGAGHLYYAVPSAPGPFPLLIFLHGAMGNFQSYLHHWRRYHPGEYAVVCPSFGFGRWYRPGGTEAVEAALRFALEHLNVRADQVVLIGQSNGATGAVRAVAAYPESFQHLVLISPVLEPSRVSSAPFVAWARSHPPLVIEGTQDSNVPPWAVKQGVEAMRGAGATVDYRVFPGEDHFLMFSAREPLFKALDEFLGTQASL